jgi:hypothetical protein
VNRSISRAKPGSSAARTVLAMAVRAKRNPALRLKITSSIWRQSRRQVRPESGLYLRELRRRGGAGHQRQLPESLPPVPMVQARRRQARRSCIRLPGHDAARADGPSVRKGTGDHSQLPAVRCHPGQPPGPGHSSGRRHPRDQRPDPPERARPVPPTWEASMNHDRTGADHDASARKHRHLAASVVRAAEDPLGHGRRPDDSEQRHQDR